MRTAQAAGNWQEAFNFADLGGAKSSYTVKRLEPGTQHAFIVATIAANGAATYSAWVFLTTAGGQHPGFCPVTGLPLGDGYKSIDDTVTGITGTYTLQSVTYPRSVQITAGGNYFPAFEGRQWIRTCGTFYNGIGRNIGWYFRSGSDIQIDSDAGIGFTVPNHADGSISNTLVLSGARKRLCQTWTLPATAQTIIIPVNLGLTQSDIHLYRVDREQ